MYCHMRRFFLLLMIPAVASAQTDRRVRELDAYAAQAVRDWGAPGLAIAVVKDGRVVFAKGYGVLELGKPAPVDTQTIFAIGSTTKAMTTMALAMLVDEGKCVGTIRSPGTCPRSSSLIRTSRARSRCATS
jgi:CubicO group peptidase (beta-lactamase class C family)